MAVKKQILARWRESGEWWSGEPYREIVRFIDERGIRQEEQRTSRSVGRLTTYQPKPDNPDHREEWSLRIRKTRDEKVAKACGHLQEEPFSFAIASKDTCPRTIPYAPLHLNSGYALGRATILAEELPILCAEAGITAAALCDPFALTGAFEFVRRAKGLGIKPLVGTSLELAEGGWIVLIARNKAGYLSLSRLITSCHLEEPRQFPLCTWERLERFAEGLLCLTGGDPGPLNRLITRGQLREAREVLEKLIRLYGKQHVFIEIERSYLPWETSVNKTLIDLAEECRVMPVAGGVVTHGRREHFPTQDIIVCAETLCTVDELIGRKPQRHPLQPQIEARPERALNAERFLKTPLEMAKLFADRPDLLTNTLKVAELCEDDLMPGRANMPTVFPNPNQTLCEITYAGARELHGSISPQLKKQLDHELKRMCTLHYSEHFLAAWDACQWARSQGIQFSGRGSVVDSAVAYCLGFSRIDAFRHNLHFDRFLPGDGSKRPDIDIDFEARRRDEIRSYFSEKYGADRVAGISAVGAYATRGIVREVGKALGLPTEIIGFLTKRIHGGVAPDQLESAMQRRPELANSGIPKERFRWVFELAERLMDIPRNMRSHSSGLILADRPISDYAPLIWSASPFVKQRLSSDDFSMEEDETVLFPIIQWDKRSAKHVFDKFDLLCLRGQDVLSGTQERVRLVDKSFDVEKLGTDDEETYRAMRSGELIGIPQSASPAMRQAHIRLRTENLDDASLVQAGIRPGVGGAVKINELIARRRGKPYSFEHPDFEGILGNTYGVIVFQEQVDQLLQTFARYTSGEAEDTRDAIHKRRREDYGAKIKQEIIDRIKSCGYNQVVAEKVYEYVSGFKGYGFAQGHALAFAEISIRSIYCQQNYPAEYFAALLTAQPAGYYGPCTIVNEARIRGVAILPPDVNRSAETFSVEDIKSTMDPKIVLPNAAIRVGLMQISGVSKETRKKIVGERKEGYLSIFDFAMRVQPDRDELEYLILCGVFESLHPNRRALLWAIPEVMTYAASKLDSRRLPLLTPEPELDESMADINMAEKAIHERSILDLDITRHIMCFERERVASRGGITSGQAKTLKPGRKGIVVGNPIRLRFPPTSSGKRVVFFDLEDETGLLNVTCFDDVYCRDGHAIVCSPYVCIIGEAQDRDGHTAFLAHRVFQYYPCLRSLTDENIELPLVTGDFLMK